MNKLIITSLLFLITNLCSAAMTQIMVTRIPATDTQAEMFVTQTYGINSDGSPKSVTMTGATVTSSKVKSFYQHFSLARDITRYIIYFQTDGTTVSYINFQLASPYQDLGHTAMDGSAQSDLTTLQAYITNYTP